MTSFIGAQVFYYALSSLFIVCPMLLGELGYELLGGWGAAVGASCGLVIALGFYPRLERTVCKRKPKLMAADQSGG
jgi:hypothetical protein